MSDPFEFVNGHCEIGWFPDSRHLFYHPLRDNEERNLAILDTNERLNEVWRTRNISKAAIGPSGHLYMVQGDYLAVHNKKGDEQYSYELLSFGRDLSVSKDHVWIGPREGRDARIYTPTKDPYPRTLDLGGLGDNLLVHLCDKSNAAAAMTRTGVYLYGLDPSDDTYGKICGPLVDFDNHDPICKGLLGAYANVQIASWSSQDGLHGLIVVLVGHCLIFKRYEKAPWNDVPWIIKDFEAVVRLADHGLGAKNVVSLTLSSDGANTAVLTERGTLLILQNGPGGPIKTYKEELAERLREGTFLTIAWSPDDELLAFKFDEDHDSRKPKIHLMRVEPEMRAVKPVEKRVAELAESPCAKRPKTRA